MGVDFSHCNARWAYSGFMRFRQKLAAEVGLNLSEMAGYDGTKAWPPEPWEDPVYYLLDHSDCDGYLPPVICQMLAPRLRSLVAEWPDEDGDKQRALELARGMDAAAASNEPLEFY